MRKAIKVAKVEERILGRKEVERKEVRGKKKVEKEKRELAGRVARQDTLQLGAGKEVTRICTQLIKTRTKTLRSQRRRKMICRHGVYWKRAKVNSGKR